MCCSLPVLAQKTTSSARAARHYKFALQAAKDRVYHKAILFTDKAIEIDADFVEAYIVRGDIHSTVGEDSLAILDYKKALALDPKFSFALNYRLAGLEHKHGFFEDALKHIDIYLTGKKISDSYRKKALRKRKTYAFAVDAVNNPVIFQPMEMGDSINTLDDEYLPAISADGNTFIFTKSFRVNGARTEDFYLSNRNDSLVYKKALPLGPPINTDQNEGAQCISPDGNTIYYTACSRSDGHGGCDLYVSYKLNGRWSEPQNMGPSINSESWESQPSISSDGRRLFFASDREGGYGGKDIWVSYKNYNGTWTEPKNLGEEINTAYDDISPFIHWDNTTLYYASKGKVGMGGYDIFLSKPEGNSDKWTEAENIGYPINTQKDENSLVVAKDGKTAYFAAENLSNGRADLDLYYFELPEKSRARDVAYIQGFVYDADSRVPIGASIEISDLATDKPIMSLTALDSQGDFFACLPSDKDYALNVYRDGYLFHSENFSFKGKAEQQRIFVIEVALKKIKAGELVRLENIFFQHDSYELEPQSAIELNRIVSFLNNNTSPVIEISGHTDNTGTSSYNMALSRKRAKAIWQALLDRGVPSSRITYKGYGDTEPITANETEGQRARNRRTELKIIKP